MNEMSEMIQGRDIICFANDYDSDPLSKKHLMSRLAQKNRVLWVNSIGTRNPQMSVRDFRRVVDKLKQFSVGCQRRSENLFLFNPIAVPFHGFSAAQWINRHWLTWSLRRACRQLGFRHPITWTFVPTSADVVGELDEEFIIYHCVDEFSEFTGTDKTALFKMEQRLMKKADMVVVSSGPLYEDKRRFNPNSFLVTHGVDVQHFRKACDPETLVPDEIAVLKKPVIGFHGLIADWVDLELVKYLARARPQWSLVLVGKIDTNTELLRGVPNVHLLGQKDYAQLPAYCKGFDVAILPFVINELTLASNPLKLREYLAAGLPVVSTSIPEAARLGGLLRIGENYEHFLEQIEGYLANRNGSSAISISKSMDSESWESKVIEVSGMIGQVRANRAHGPNTLPMQADLKESWIGSS